jgi:predicted DNA-binding transcriptional regulator YafY
MPGSRSPGPVKTTRPPLERMNFIHEQLEAGKLPNCSSIAKVFEVASKTIQRDIDFMRDRLGYPIEWDAERRGYYYTGPVEHMPLATISEGELVAMLVAQKAVEQFKGTPFEKPLANAFAKIASQLDGPVTVAIGEARSAITFKPIGVGRGDLELFRRLSQAVLHSVEIEFEYDKGDVNSLRHRRLQPWHLCCVDNQWYAIGHDIDRQEKRTFAVTRMSAVKLTRRSFVRPREFSIKDHLGGAFGIFAGTGDHRIRLRFDGWAVKIVRERFWHESQKFFERRDGALEMELHLGSLEEIQRWILGFGERVEVLRPAALRRAIREIAVNVAARHHG